VGIFQFSIFNLQTAMSFPASPWTVGRKRPGFTLLEMLLVLALMTALAAIAVPSLQGPLADRRLRSGAEEVRAAWLTARSEAMTSAQIYMFRYEPQTGNYTIGPWDGDQAALDATSTASAGIAGSVTTLPEGVTFIGGVQQQDTRAATGGSGGSIGGGSSAPAVLFYTDGSTSTVQLELRHEIGLGIHLSMRGLTGAVSVSDTYALEEAGR
jgi:type II secretion system protein H